jgi:hypothetical protein
MRLAPMSKPTTSRALRPYPTPKGYQWEVNRRILYSPLAAAAKVVLLIIIDHARHGQSVCTASNATLAREAGCQPRHVIRIVRELEKRGWITLDRKGPTVNFGRTLGMGPLCSIGQTPLCRTVHTPCDTQDIGVCPPGHPNVSPMDQKKDTNSRVGGKTPEKPKPPCSACARAREWLADSSRHLLHGQARKHLETCAATTRPAPG